MSNDMKRWLEGSSPNIFCPCCKKGDDDCACSTVCVPGQQHAPFVEAAPGVRRTPSTEAIRKASDESK